MREENKNKALVEALQQPGKADRRSQRAFVRRYLSEIIAAREELGKDWEEIADDIFAKERIRIRPTTLGCYVSQLRVPLRPASFKKPSSAAENSRFTGSSLATERPNSMESQVKGEIRPVTPRRLR